MMMPASDMKDLFRDAVDKPEWGALRFICECGLTTTDGGEAVEHAFYGHNCVREKFAGGEWIYADTLHERDLISWIAAKLQLKGESRREFERRLQLEIAGAKERMALYDKPMLYRKPDGTRFEA